ncbi:MAG: hypothetical protein ACFFAS_20600 [Promethearchaeota archaeon]
MVITCIALMPLFGPQPLENPIAVAIFLAVLIISCCLLSLNRVIVGALRSKVRDKTQKVIMCPQCLIPVEKENAICPQCGRAL